MVQGSKRWAFMANVPGCQLIFCGSMECLPSVIRDSTLNIRDLGPPGKPVRTYYKLASTTPKFFYRYYKNNLSMRLHDRDWTCGERNRLLWRWRIGHLLDDCMPPARSAPHGTRSLQSELLAWRVQLYRCMGRVTPQCIFDNVLSSGSPRIAVRNLKKKKKSTEVTTLQI